VDKRQKARGSPWCHVEVMRLVLYRFALFAVCPHSWRSSKGNEGIMEPEWHPSLLECSSGVLTFHPLELKMNCALMVYQQQEQENDKQQPTRRSSHKNLIFFHMH